MAGSPDRGFSAAPGIGKGSGMDAMVAVPARAKQPPGAAALSLRE
jgi:hypothetical protein